MDFALNLLARRMGLGPIGAPSRKGALCVGKGDFALEFEPNSSTFEVRRAPDTALPSVHDPFLASVLRDLVRSPGFSNRRVILRGPTLLGWWHLRAQLPWKKLVTVFVEAESDGEVEASLRAMSASVEVRETTLGEDDARGFACELRDPESRRTVTVHVAPIQPGAIPSNLSTLDGGTPVWVPADASARLKKWYAKQNISIFGNKIRCLPDGWCWNRDTDRFVEVDHVKAALTWPISKQTFLYFIRAIAVVGTLFLLFVYMGPEIGGIIDDTARALFVRRWNDSRQTFSQTSSPSPKSRTSRKTPRGSLSDGTTVSTSARAASSTT